MKKAEQLKICNYSLLAITVLILASGIQLEVLAGSSRFWVWVHVVLGLQFFGFIFLHIYLHFKWRNWIEILWNQKSANTRWMMVTSILTLLTALIATTGWIMSPDHSAIGAIHGKLGFTFIALALWHISKRLKYYRNLVASR